MYLIATFVTRGLAISCYFLSQNTLDWEEPLDSVSFYSRVTNYVSLSPNCIIKLPSLSIFALEKSKCDL